MAASVACAQDSLQFRSGEQLHFRIKYLGWNAGEMNLWLEHDSLDGQPTYRVNVTARTNGLAGSLFRVANEYESYFDVNSFAPYIVNKKIAQKNVQHHRQICYDHLAGKAMSDSVETWNIPSDTYGFFSMLYLIRSLQHVDSLKFHVEAEQKISIAHLQRCESEYIRFQDKKRMTDCYTLRYEPYAQMKRSWKTDLLTNRLTQPHSKMSIWITRDSHRIPLRIKFHQEPFDLLMTLRSYNIIENQDNR